MTADEAAWPTAADVPPSPCPVRAKWPRGAGRHRAVEPDESPTVVLDPPTVPFLFTHPALYSGIETVPGGTL
ncbi:hypothetical protein [Amycolatopsis echigonensis]|uniref:Uncharacterized protein n=1 Tax=Amycolatopsis echigonensis TaxID=2576905 RepID=A0A8E1W8S9_9PSEU|nr:hypothetical protein [Amycolatopsis echigonensis]MBB2506002.1 hypothetical protein [Amycolatopsis echigonensis]